MSKQEERLSPAQRKVLGKLKDGYEVRRQGWNYLLFKEGPYPTETVLKSTFDAVRDTGLLYPSEDRNDTYLYLDESPIDIRRRLLQTEIRQAEAKLNHLKKELRNL